MAFDVSYTLESEQQFWDELQDILAIDTHEHEQIDDTLRTYLSFLAQFKGEYLTTDYDVLRSAYRLHSSAIFKNEEEYVRTQMLYCMLQEDSAEPLHIVTVFLLYDGRQHEGTFETLNEEGGFARILELIQTVQDEGLHRHLLELLYEMSRIQRLKLQDLMLIDEDFILYLLKITESLSADVNDPYHYYVIRVLLVLNEQYMVSAHEPRTDGSEATGLPNLVITTLSRHGPSYKTFGENIILLLNRESETSLQLLILKLLYLLFTTPATYEYFYTNDLRVLVDVMVRNLLDLAFSSTALRHTYLRVLYPLLGHTQLKNPDNHYKRDELLKLLTVMGTGGTGLLHFGAMDDTTQRLVKRCLQVDWLREVSVTAASTTVLAATDDASSATADSPLVGSSSGSPITGNNSPRSKYLQIGGSNADANKSSLSVAEVTAPRAKPGERTMTRDEERAKEVEKEAEKEAEQKEIKVRSPPRKPPPPRARRKTGTSAGGAVKPGGAQPPPKMPEIKNPFQTEVEG